MLALPLIAHLALAAAPPLELDALLRQVSERAPAVAVERESVTAAQAAINVAGAWEDPQLSVMAENMPLPGQSWSMARMDPMAPMVTYRFAQPLNVFGRRGLAKDAATARARVSQQQLRRVEFDARAQAVGAFYELWMNEQTAAVLDRQIALMQQMREAAKARYAAGLDMAHHDVLRAGSEVSTMSAERQSLESERMAITAMLNVLRGEPAVAEVGSATLPERPPLPEKEALLANASGRPEVASAEAMRAAMQSELGLARKMYLPMVMAEAFYQQRLTPDPNMIGGAVTVSVPLWFFDRQRNEVAMAEAELRRADKDVAAMRLMTESELLAAWSRAVAADRALKAIESSALPAARETVDADKAAYVSGTGTFINLLESLTALREVEMRRIQAVVRRETTRYELERLLAQAPSEGGAP